MLVVRWLVLWDRSNNFNAGKNPQGNSSDLSAFSSDTNTGTITRISVIPAARHVAAPYPVHCKFTLIGGGKQGASVVLEGPKVNQPAEVVLEELFHPEIEPIGAGADIRGVLVELLPTRRSLDLSLSRCIVERTSPGNVNGGPAVIRYIPWSLSPLSRPSRAPRITNTPEQGQQKQRAFPVFLDSNSSSNLVAINSGTSTGTVGLEMVNFNASNSQSESSSRSIIGARHVEDTNVIDKNLLDLHVDSGVCLEYSLVPTSGTSNETSKPNSVRGAIGIMEASNSEDIAIYFVERNKQNNSLLSVSTL